jgi:hypothetical protein
MGINAFKLAPFTFDALRPYVSATLHKIQTEKAIPSSQELASELSRGLDSFFDVLEIADENPHRISPSPDDRGLIETKTEENLSLTGIWFKRTSAPTWLDAELGPEEVRDVINHILIFAIRSPYLAVVGTHEATRELLSKDLAIGQCGKIQLSFIAPPIDRATLERAFVRGQTRVSWLTGLHARVATKPDSKTLQGRDLRYAIDPFGDQSFTYTSAISILPELQHREIKPRRVSYEVEDIKTKAKYERYAFRVGVTPEQHRVWTIAPKQFKYFKEELLVLFDTLDLPANPKIIFDWGHNQEGLKFLAQPIPAEQLKDVKHAFDVGLDLPPPLEAGGSLSFNSEREVSQEKWRASGRLEVIETYENSADFTAGVFYNDELMARFEVTPRQLTKDLVHLDVHTYEPIETYHEGLTSFEKLFFEDISVRMTVRYDSNHVISGVIEAGCPLFLLRWQDVLFDSWRWCFKSKGSRHQYDASKEKPPSKPGAKDDPSREKGLGWEKTLANPVGNPASLFEYTVVNAKKLFNPRGDWHLCCDDGPGEVADFIYFEPGAGRLYLIHIKGAGKSSVGKGKKSTSKKKKTDELTRDISVKTYEEVVSQAIKNIRYLDVVNLWSLLKQGVTKKGDKLPIWETSFLNGKMVGRDTILKALEAHKLRLLDKRVIVFQPHVRKTLWNEAQDEWRKGAESSPKNQINRFLQLRTLLADAEITCRKIGVQFEVWGEDDDSTGSTTYE